MNKKPIEVVIIHDELKENDTLVFQLREKYESVKLITDSNEGLKYVMDNLSKKMVVILDRNFRANEPTGFEVFEKIRQKTSLVHIIIWTADQLFQIESEELKEFINNHALALLTSSDGAEEIIKQVDNAAHQLDIRLDSALEQWISLHPESEKQSPYIVSRDGKSYTLNEILNEIRLKTPFGMDTEKDILLLAIDMLSRGKKKID